MVANQSLNSLGKSDGDEKEKLALLPSVLQYINLFKRARQRKVPQPRDSHRDVSDAERSAAPPPFACTIGACRFDKVDIP
jgi:hypothetical protein